MYFKFFSIPKLELSVNLGTSFLPIGTPSTGNVITLESIVVES